MEINKEYLGEKLNMFKNKHIELSKIVDDNIILLRKLEGAIETVQLLLKELENTDNKE